MQKILSLIDRIRGQMHDKDAIGYDDTDLLGFLNDAARYLRKIIIANNCALLVDIQDDYKAENGILTMQRPVAKILSITHNGTKIKPSSVFDNNGDSCSQYYLMQWDKIAITPKPDDNTVYHVVAISDFKPFDLPDTPDFPYALEDFLIDYAVIRAGMINEFDMSQEMNVFADLTSKVITYLQSIVNVPVQVGGYWG